MGEMRNDEALEQSPDDPLSVGAVSIDALILAKLQRDPRRPDRIGTLMLEVRFPPRYSGATPVITDKYPVSALGPFDGPPDSPEAMEFARSRAAAFVDDVVDVLDDMLPVLLNNITVLAVTQAAPEGERFFTNRTTLQLKIINTLTRNIKQKLGLPDDSKPGPKRRAVAPGQIVAAIRKVAKSGQAVTQENVAGQLQISVSTFERV